MRNYLDCDTKQNRRDSSWRVPRYLTKMDKERILQFKNSKEAINYLENPDVKLTKPSLAVLEDGSIIIHSGDFE